MGLRVKICGITQPEQGRAIVELGATALGFICATESPRYISPAQIQAIVAELPIDTATGTVTCDRIGVFVNLDLSTICKTVEVGNLTGVQLHGTESPEFCYQLRVALPHIEIIKALRIRTPEAVSQANFYEGWVNTLLLDAYHPTMAGGTGTTLNWKALHKFRPECPWFLAGGLSPDNLAEALSQIRPDGIDLSSSVEHAPGDKNLDEVARLFQALRSIS